MPEYDYACPCCGPFFMFRPMAEYAEPQECPDCGRMALRGHLSAPAIAGKGAKPMMAAINERNPEAGSRFSTGTSHPGGCGCCSSGGWKPVRKADWIRKLL